MFLPIGDTPNPRGYVPWVNWALIAANVGIYLLISLPLSLQSVDPLDPNLREYLRQIAPSLPAWASLREIAAGVSAYDLFTFTHGYKPGAPAWLDLLFAMFLHGGALHLAGNMLFLWIFGDNVEHRLGRVGYLLTYLTTGALATLTFAAFAGDSMLPLVGASGAISGVLGLYFLLFPRNRVKVFVFLFPFLVDVWLLPVRWVLGFYVLLDNLLPILFGAQTGVAHGAHLGGFLAGLLFAWSGERLSWQRPWAARGRRLGRAGGPGVARRRDSPRLEALRRALTSGESSEALAALYGLNPQELAALEPAECAKLADWLQSAGRVTEAVSLLRRCLAANPGSRDLAQVYLALGLIRLSQGQPTAAFQHLQTALDSRPDPATEARTRSALEMIDVYRGYGRARRLL